MAKPLGRRIRQALSRMKLRSFALLGRAAWRIRAQRVTAAQVERDLANGGVRKGDLLVVHASLSRIGDVEGGSATVCSVLESLVDRDGTLVMPTYFQPRPILEMLAENVVVDLRVAPSFTGKLSETFRKREGVTRSSHPFSSCSAWGALGPQITSGHESTPLLCGRGSPLANVWEGNGRILGIGVDLGPVSFYHVVEDTWEEYPIRTRLENPFRVTYVDSDGKTVCRDVFILDASVSRTRIERNEWLRLWLRNHLREAGILHEFVVGEAPCWIMDAGALYDELVALARRGITIYTTAHTFPDP